MAGIGRGVAGKRGMHTGTESHKLTTGKVSPSVTPSTTKKTAGAIGTKGTGSKAEPAYKPKGPRKIGRPS